MGHDQLTCLGEVGARAGVVAFVLDGVVARQQQLTYFRAGVVGVAYEITGVGQCSATMAASVSASSEEGQDCP